MTDQAYYIRVDVHLFRLLGEQNLMELLEMSAGEINKAINLAQRHYSPYICGFCDAVYTSVPVTSYQKGEMEWCPACSTENEIYAQFVCAECQEPCRSHIAIRRGNRIVCPSCDSRRCLKIGSPILICETHGYIDDSQHFFVSSAVTAEHEHEKDHTCDVYRGVWSPPMFPRFMKSEIKRGK